ncbi:conserved hypothetical protein [Talaromyces stipitatus ATCC 10500]|uniref:Uncharacterized protein n=1 Tax=Talaromyces stipitatus (strain ATCC 10500 / CBS 375.48 / QM 6759 / NRRL 1006) TaxID=441959 RepID=B8M145_TALSN|nr:uncharacterized protein TSTA_082200 [Talaromyces stipitatus ATCC 10500]EED20987.1 conserved hypothetical protein [Talaromyces stipitatus ATCC 10500]
MDLINDSWSPLSAFYVIKSYFTTLWLFTADDCFSILIPNVVCGSVLALTGIPFSSDFLLLEILGRTHVDAAIQEDAENKPWRPLPSQRISQPQSKLLHCALRPLLLVISAMTGGIVPSVCIQILTFAYNDMRLGDQWYFRNCLNAGGYISFLLGAIQAALHKFTLKYSKLACIWLSLIFFAVTTGIHAMDLYDMSGDLKRGRRTVPIAMGERCARITIVISVSVVSLSAATTIGVSSLSSVPVIATAAVIVRRLYIADELNERAHKTTFKIWCLWIGLLYLLPALHNLSFYLQSSC